MRKKSLLLFGCLAERLRRWTRNPLGNSRVGSNPAAVVNSTFCLHFDDGNCLVYRMYV